MFLTLLQSIPSPQIVNSGGWENWNYVKNYKTKQDIEEERIRLGITVKVAKVIDNVVEGLLSDPDQNKQKELKYQLNLQSISYDTKYLKALNHQYQVLLKDEIAFRLRQKQDIDDIHIIMMLM